MSDRIHTRQNRSTMGPRCWIQGGLLPFLCAGSFLSAVCGTRMASAEGFEDWRIGGDWYEAGDVRVDVYNERRLIGDRGTGVLVNGRIGKTQSLVTKRRDYGDAEVHLEFLVARGSNSGVIFHGNHEIQILDSYGVASPTAGHCGGVYPPAESEPTYRHLPGGAPPRINAAKPPGEWQSLDIVFRAARFTPAGRKIEHARFVRVVHNGVLIQENVEVPHASGTNWDRPQHPRGPIIIQGDYGPIAVRNLRVRDGRSESLPPHRRNVAPPGFTALFNGEDLTGWHTSPEVLDAWSVEDGVLKSHGLVEHYRASLVTRKQYRDFILLLEFRFPTISDSGICFRRLLPEIPGFGKLEQFNLRSGGGLGHLESYYFLPHGIARRVGLQEEEEPHVRHIDPEVGVWHRVKLTMNGRTFSAEYDGEVLYDRFRFHDWMMSLEPGPILLQKHQVVRGGNLGGENPCPIEFRNVFIRELGPDASGDASASSQRAWHDPARDASNHEDHLARIEVQDLPKGYDPARHQVYVDSRLADLTEAQRRRISALWNEKQARDPDMSNRGFSFVKILAYVADEEQLSATGIRELDPDVSQRRSQE